MKPLFPIVVAILVIAVNAHPENIEDVKELPQNKEPVVEAEASDPQTRTERCTACSSSLNLKSPKDILAALKTLPNSEVHTQESFEGCSSEKGCAGIKVKDGKVVQKFGNLQAFNAAANADSANEFQFQAAGNSVFEGAVPNGGPFWWMNQNSPFKAGAAGSAGGLGAAGGAGSGSFEKFSKSSSSFSSSSNGGAGGLDLAANPFLNGEFSKLSGAGFNAAGGNSQFANRQSFESTSAKEIDITGNPFLNGQVGLGANQAGFGSGSQNSFGANSQGGFGATGSAGQAGLGASQSNFNSAQGSQSSFAAGQGSQSGFGGAQGGKSGFGGAQASQNGFGSAQGGQSGFNAFNANANSNKFASNGYTGSSPSPFAPSSGSNVNLIQNTQKSEYDFQQQQQTQQNIDEAFRNTGNVQPGNSGGDLQQTCAGQGYVCVQKSQCNNGVVNTNGGGLLQANTQKQYCNTRTEICCRIETSSLAGTGNLQGSLGVGSGTYQGAANQGSGLFSQSGSSQTNQNNFGAGTSGSSGFGQATNGFNAVNRGSSVGTNQFDASASSFGTNKFGSTASTGFGSVGSTLPPNRFGSTGNFNNEVYKATSQSNFVETDSFSSGSENNGFFRPGATGSGLKPGIPYLPPQETPVSTKAPEYLPPVDPLSPSSSQTVTVNYLRTTPPTTGSVIEDQFPTTPAVPRITSDVPSGCAAALKCTPIEYCTAEGVISTSIVALTRDQEIYRVPLTDCRDQSGRVGKCCRDPLYTDPWPTNQIGKWVPGVFGGNDGKYVPDSRVSSNNQPGVTVRPPTTGSVYANNVLPSKPTQPQGPNQVTPGFPSSTPTPSFVQKNQFGQGSYSQGGRGSFSQGGRGTYSQGGQGSFSQGGQGSFSQGGQGSFGQGGRGQVAVQGQTQLASGGQGNQGQLSQGSNFQGQSVAQGLYGQGTQVRQGQGVGVRQGQGQIIRQGSGVQVTGGQGFGVAQGGQTVSQGGGFGTTQSQGVGITQGQGFGITQEQGSGVRRGQGFAVTGGQGSQVTRGQGQVVSQGGGFGVNQGQGFGVSQGQGVGIRQGTGFGVSQGGGAITSQGGGFGVSQGGFGVSQGVGFGVSQGQGQGVIRGQGQTVFQGQGQKLIQGEGEEIITGIGTGVRRGQGFTVTQNGGFGVEVESAESVQRVFLPKYGGSGECGVLNPLKPFGNRKDLEVDFAEIPWQAMVLLQTNRSLLCGGVITRPDVVITSASCVEGLQAKNVLIKGGEWKLGIDEEPLPFQIVQVKHILRHPLYKSGSFINDAAILVLTENLRLAKNIWPICLPAASDTLDGFYNGAGECIVTGWGKSVLQSHLLGSVMHSLNVSLLNPGDCQSKISQDYPHLQEYYDQESCVCGQPTNPANNICKVDIGSALACTSGDNHFVLRGIYSWDSGCQTGNQLASFYKFDLEWYEWAIGLVESVRFSQYTTTKVTKNKITTQVTGVKTFGSGVKGSSGVKGALISGGTAISGSGLQGFGLQGQQQSGQYNQFGSTNFGTNKFSESGEFSTEFKGPIQNTYSATYKEKKYFQTEPKIVTYTTKPEIVTFTTKPEIVTFTTKPEYFTYTTKPKIVTYTTKPEIVTYTTKPEIFTYTTKPEIVTYTTKPKLVKFDYVSSSSQTNQQVVDPGTSFNPSFTEVVGAKHTHDAKCKCLDGNGKKK